MTAADPSGKTSPVPSFERVLPRPELPQGPFLVVGLARSGQAAAQLLASRGAEVFGVDSGRPQDSETLGDFGVDAHLASDGLDLVERVQTVIKSPGVPGHAPVIVAAEQAGKTVLGELELGWRLIDNPVIAVTGTNGKTTTTTLLGAIYEEAGQPYALAGNIGTPLCALAAGIDPDATVICEVSSFQLDDADAFTPECGILLTVTEDHMDRYQSFAAYRDSKLSMFARQRPGQFAISGPAIDFELPGGGFKARVVSERFENNGAIAMRGRHNVDNALTAAHAALLMGVDPAAVESALATFAGVEHRMEFVGSVNGVEYINDSKATNVDAALAALASFDGDVHVILGGSLKNQRFDGLADALSAACAGVYSYGEAAAAIAGDLEDLDAPFQSFATMDEAFAAAAASATEGQTVLLSPACASFDLYDNYEQRGEAFKANVAALES